MKLFYGLIIISLFFGQDKKEEKKTGWQNSMVSKLDFSQSSFSNWQKGGDDALAWQFQILAYFKNSKDTYEWTTSGKLTFGQTKISGQDVRNTTDEIKIESVYAIKLDPESKLNPYASFSWVTQFTEGFNYETDPPTRISHFMDPGYFTEAIGFKYTPSESFNTRLGLSAKQTLTSKHTQTTDDPATTEIETSKSEFGFEWNSELKYDISENANFRSKLDVFSNTKAIDQVDVNWDNTLSAKVSPYIVFSFNIELFYDLDFNQQRQLKQILSLGLTYDLL